MSCHNQIVSVTFDTRDIQRWAGPFDLPEAVQRRVVTRALERVAAQTTRNIAEAAPVDTGRLRRSFRYRLDAQDTVALLYVLEDAAIGAIWNTGPCTFPPVPSSRRICCE